MMTKMQWVWLLILVFSAPSAIALMFGYVVYNFALARY